MSGSSATDGRVLMVFSSPGCAPCRQMEPVLAELRRRIPPDVRWVDIDITLDPEVARRHNVLGAPTVLGFDDGVPVARANGYHGLDALRARLAPLLSSRPWP